MNVVVKMNIGSLTARAYVSSNMMLMETTPRGMNFEINTVSDEMVFQDTYYNKEVSCSV